MLSLVKNKCFNYFNHKKINVVSLVMLFRRKEGGKEREINNSIIYFIFLYKQKERKPL